MKSFISWCKRYLSVMALAVITFIAYILFIQDNSLFKYMEYSRSIDSLRVEIKQATDTMMYYKELNSRLSSDPSTMERVVREQYNMNREGEDIYIFTE